MSSLATAVTKKSLKIRPEAESSCLKLRANGNEAGLTIFPLDRKPRITRDESRLFAFYRLKSKKMIISSIIFYISSHLPKIIYFFFWRPSQESFFPIKTYVIFFGGSSTHEISNYSWIRYFVIVKNQYMFYLYTLGQNSIICPKNQILILFTKFTFSETHFFSKLTLFFQI